MDRENVEIGEIIKYRRSKRIKKSKKIKRAKSNKNSKPAKRIKRRSKNNKKVKSRRSKRIKRRSKKNKKVKPEKNDGNIVLKDYQINSIYKIVESNKFQHGLLLWWMMGTGKTIGGLTFVMNYPGKKVNIICPKNIIFMWKNELEKFPSIDPNLISFFDYDEPDKIFNKPTYIDEIIVVDEAHRIVPIIKKRDILISMKLLSTSLKILLLTGTPIYNDTSDLSYLVNLAANNTILPYNSTEFTNRFYKINKQRSAFVGYSVSIMSNITRAKDMLFNVLTPAVMLTAVINPSAADKFVQENNPVSVITGKGPASKKAFLTTAYGIVFLSVVFDYIKVLIDYKIEDYKYLDTELLVNTIQPYVSYYKNEEDDENFPSVSNYTILVPYSPYQLDRWMQITQGMLDIQNIKDLKITSAEDAEFYSGKLNIDQYKNNGVAIGNFKDQQNNKYSPKFEKIYEKAKGKRAVFYSSFVENGILIFKEFLESKGEKPMYFSLDITDTVKNEILENFKNGINNFILLHPSYTEGITIFGAEQIHMIEPIGSVPKKDQVIARVVRFKSHEHLEQSKRHVDIFQWGCEMETWVDKLNKTAASIKNWYKFSPEVFYTDKSYLKFSQNVTPDSIVLKEEVINRKNINSMAEIIKKLSYNEHISCCINVPSGEQDSECMVKHKMHCNEKNTTDVKDV